MVKQTTVFMHSALPPDGILTEGAMCPASTCGRPDHALETTFGFSQLNQIDSAMLLSSKCQCVEKK
jgi:hypothetical protein